MALYSLQLFSEADFRMPCLTWMYTWMFLGLCNGFPMLCSHLWSCDTSRPPTMEPREQKSGRRYTRLNFSFKVRGCAWQQQWKVKAQKHSLGVKMCLSPASKALSQESWWELRWECLSCSMHLKMLWLDQVPGSERKWKQFLLRNMIL